ncbi:MAG: hypothetical protein BWY52_02091 [Chloroflexi bacterium ADurb.Bin325]|nr:MAG: hypothetical protein BWY52_02091 [Chloroflexi bacterium ADurb.Bin325]
MLAVTCDKCRRRFTPTDEELQGYLRQAEGKKYALVLCPHCGKGNKIALARLAQALSGVRRAPAPAEQAAAGEQAAPAEPTQTE